MVKYCQVCGERRSEELSDHRMSTPRQYWTRRNGKDIRLCCSCWREASERMRRQFIEGQAEEIERRMTAWGCAGCESYVNVGPWHGCRRVEGRKLARQDKKGFPYAATLILQVKQCPKGGKEVVNRRLEYGSEEATHTETVN